VDYVGEKRNNICFQEECWRNVQALLGSCARTVKNWMLVNRTGDAAKLRLGARTGEKKWEPAKIDMEVIFGNCGV
jgi:hypothetical protein